MEEQRKAEILRRREIGYKRAEEYRKLLDFAYDFLSPIMSEERIRNMPLRKLLIELERRRLFIEQNRKEMERRQLEEQLKEQKRSNQNRK